MNTDKPESRDALRDRLRGNIADIIEQHSDPDEAAEAVMAALDREGRVPANDEPAPGTLDEEQRHVLQECLNEAKFKLTFNAEVKLGPLLSQRVYVLEDMLRSRAAANDEGAKIADGLEQMIDSDFPNDTPLLREAAAYIRRSAKP